MENKKILYVEWGGLGDHLQFSTLPEISNKNGYDFYMSHLSKFRNNQTLDLVWSSNPYFKGISEEPPNCGHGYTDISGLNPEISLNRNWVDKIGFGNPDLVNGSKYPAIYYEPKLIEEFKDCLLIDLNGVHFKDNGYTYNWNLIKGHIESDIAEKKYKNIYFIEPNDVNYSNARFDFTIGKSIFIKNIFDYADFIYSSKKFFTIWAGGSHLASAIKWKYKPELELSTFTNNTSKCMFWYDNVDYLKGFMVNAPFK